jgi:hypothetical protein
MAMFSIIIQIVDDSTCIIVLFVDVNMKPMFTHKFLISIFVFNFILMGRVNGNTVHPYS